MMEVFTFNYFWGVLISKTNVENKFKIAQYRWVIDQMLSFKATTSRTKTNLLSSLNPQYINWYKQN